MVRLMRWPTLPGLRWSDHANVLGVRQESAEGDVQLGLGNNVGRVCCLQPDSRRFHSASGTYCNLTIVEVAAQSEWRYHFGTTNGLAQPIRLTSMSMEPFTDADSVSILVTAIPPTLGHRNHAR